ncbi:hypothetical protein DENSPDRAFT_835234, partial [Dentipellis sp. KUC8613]
MRPRQRAPSPQSGTSSVKAATSRSDAFVKHSGANIFLDTVVCLSLPPHTVPHNTTSPHSHES